MAGMVQDVLTTINIGKGTNLSLYFD